MSVVKTRNALTASTVKALDLPIFSNKISDCNRTRLLDTNQTQSPFTRAEAMHAARLWFAASGQTMTLAAWRDYLLERHLSAIQCSDWEMRQQRTATWNDAFNNGIAKMIAGGVFDV